MVRTNFAERLEQLRPLLLASAVLTYPIAYWVVYLLSRGDPRAVSAIAIALIAWFGGLRLGLVVGVGLAACNGIVHGIVRGLDAVGILQNRVPILVAWLALAAIVGWFSDQARRQEAERRRAEALLSQTEEQYRALVESIGEIIFQTDIAGRWTFLNPAWTTITGYSAGESLGHFSFDFLHPEYRDAARVNLRTLLTPEPDLALSTLREGCFLTKPGGIRWLEVHRNPLLDDSGRVIGLAGTMRDITARKEVDAALRRSEERLRTVVTNAPVALFAIDQRDTFTLAEGQGINLHGLPPAGLVGNDLADVFAEAPGVAEQFRRALAGETHTAIAELAGHSFEASYVPLRDERGDISGVIGVATDITKRVAYEAQLVHQAYHDPLTDLPNRVLFTDRLEASQAQSAREGTQVALLFLDLDRFKIINDSLGHNRGDRLLMSVATRLLDSVRPGDTVARLGGDEFTILLGGLAREEEATTVAGRILAQLQHPFDLDGHQVFVTTSIGIVLAQPREQPEVSGDLLRYADLALYQAKAAGKARHAIFDRSLDAAALARLELESDLRLAMERGEMAVEYQAQVDLHSGKIVGTEALLRWYHPARGSISLGEFIPLAEETGLIIEIGRWVLREACQQTAHWQQHNLGAGAEPLSVSVNLSAKQFQDPGLIPEIVAVLRETGLPPASLTLEISETVTMGQTSATKGTLHALRELGVRLAIDDFGTGYSSLGHLKHFPIDTIKIDQLFIGGLGRSAEDDAIVGAVIALGHGLGLRICGEGVETAAQAAQLRHLGCDLAQGYLFSRPLTPAALADLLTSVTPFAPRNKPPTRPLADRILV
jgi:diguanylate cyclase (GGDEF)-like protein/PAS domain S-box-containing protein